MNENIEVMLSEEKVDSRIREMGAQISRDLAGETVRMITVLKGGAMFACELAKRLTIPLTMDFLTASSYGSGTVSSGKVELKQEDDLEVEGQTVLIAEDIIDSGNTLSRLVAVMKEKGAKRVVICTLLNKPSRREVELDVDYTGFEIPDAFVVGYGLDYDQKYRNLPFVGVLKEV